MVAARFTNDSSEHVLPAGVDTAAAVCEREEGVQNGGLGTQTDLRVADEDRADTSGSRSAAVRRHGHAKALFRTHTHTHKKRRQTDRSDNRKKKAGKQEQRAKKEKGRVLSIAMKQRENEIR